MIEKKPHDSIRSTLVGVAPVFGGLATLWLLVQARLFPGSDIGNTLLFGYIILSVSANMFSSKQDLRDLIHLVPIALLIGIVWYLIPVEIPPPFIYFVTTIQYPLIVFNRVSRFVNWTAVNKEVETQYFASLQNT